jgi:uncharacterized membrane protein YfcA
LTPLELLGASAIVMLGAILQGSVGFGLGMLAAPLLVLIDPAFVPAPLLSAALALTLLVAQRERHAIDFTGVGWALGGRLPGTLLGAAVMALAPQRATTLLVGVVVFVGVGLIGSGLSLPRTPRVMFGAGTLSGFMGTTTSIGGPPIAALYHDAAGDKVRGTMSGIFVVGLVITLTALAFVGRFGRPEIVLGACLLPGAVAGYAVSSHIAPILDRGYTRTAVLAVSALAGLSVIVQGLVGQ